LIRRIAVLGCGWLGLPLALSLLGKGYAIHGSTTSKKKIVSLKRKGISPYLISITEDGIHGDIDAFLTDVSVLIVNVPPKLRGTNPENYVRKMQFLHAEVKRHGVAQLLFVSSTSVYGNLQGTVTEKSVPEPETASGQQLLAVENLFRNTPDLKTTILRFGGLIGADRHPITMLAGRTDLNNGDEFVNLIHQNDCIAIIAYIITKQCWNRTFNGVYPYHPTKSTYYTSEANKRGLRPPKYNTKKAITGKIIVPFALLNVKGFSFDTSIRS